MIADLMTDKPPAWISGNNPDAQVTVFSQCHLARNLSDFPFPGRCRDEEKRAIEERVVGVLENLNLLASGKYYSFSELSAMEVRFLAERRLITHDLIYANGARGVYVSDDQNVSIMVNGLDHVAMRVLAGGYQLQEAWNRINLLDDTLAGALDFAFSERLGYLTTLLDMVGTGLKASVLLHLPGLALMDGIKAQIERTQESRLLFFGLKAGGGESEPVTAPALRDKPGNVEAAMQAEALKDQAFHPDVGGAVLGTPSEALGDFYLLVNQGALGESEDEIVFNVRNAAAEIQAAERAARETILNDNPRGIEDRVGRARGVAENARYMSFAEGINVLSSLRLGAAAELVPDVDLTQINEMLLASQRAHLELHKGQLCDALTLSMERADAFRSRFH